MEQPPDAASGFGLFGKNVAKSTQAPVFAASTAKSVGQPTFENSRQLAAPNVFGSFSKQSRSGFGTFSGASSQSDSSAQSSSSLFGAAKPSGFGTFGGLSSQASPKPSTFSSGSIIFGAQPLFSSASQSKAQTGTSDLFGSTAASGGNNVFGRGSTTSTLSNTGARSTSGLFGAKAVTQSSNPFASSSRATVASGSKVGLGTTSFAGAGKVFPSHSSSLGVDDSEGSFRKRSSSGTMESSILFGKRQAARAAPVPSALTSFSHEGSGHNFKSQAQASGSKPVEERKLFGKETAANDAQTGQRLFSPGPPAYPGYKQMFANPSNSTFPVENSPATFPTPEPNNVKEDAAPGGSGFGVSSSGSGSTGNLFPVTPSSSTSSSKLFGKPDPSSQNMFGETSQREKKVLFGKMQPSGTPESSSSGLFGTHQAGPSQLFQGQKTSESGPDVASSSMSFQPEQARMSTANSPSKRSLSKWNRNRDSLATLEKKRTGEEGDTRESKRARGSDSRADVKTSPASVALRSRLSSQRQSVDDQNQRTSIIVRDIPVDLNKGGILRAHFSRFGVIKRLQPMPTKNAANISFQTHEEAKAAKDKGKHMGKGSPLSIFWRNVSIKSPGLTTAGPASKSPIDQKQSKSKLEHQGHIHDELSSMAGTFDHQEEISPEMSTQRGRSQRSEFQMLSSTNVPARQAHTRSSDRRSPTPPHRSVDEAESQGIPDIEIAKKLLKTMWKAKPKDATEIVSVLDARDKFLRMLQKKHSSLTSATAFVGTCEDMCPEKERYYREDIRRLALYEVIPSTMTSVTGLKSKVDHIRAVKEYSRSSADQEEPLSHELRPLHVLMTTMNYLLTEVADQGGEGKWSEWYDFLWNRTRGIRKDITQQQLCEVEVAELLEKCTRFHIFCSARLCEEDMMSFDAKINNENLTKCLQTVKELYADLEKRRVYCPNEAEFRAYMVLMNLNEGDTLREVQQLRPEIRESAHIHFALQAYHALNSSNYVRFFRLIKESTFLNACILHRYFNQIRAQALRIIMKAHRATGKNRIMYPVSEMIRLLGFEDNAQVELFCDHYCLTVERVEVVMDAQAFLQPETSIPETRSQTLVEAKRTVAVGEIINGCPLPPLQMPTPNSSFDNTGTFILPQAIQEALTKGLTGMKSTPVGPSQSQAPGLDEREHVQELSGNDARGGLPNAMEVQRSRPSFSNEGIESEVMSLIFEELDKEMKLLAEEVVMEEKHQASLIREEVMDIAAAAVQELAKNLAEEVIEEEEAKVRYRLKQEMEAQKVRVHTALCEDVVEDTVAELVNKMADEEMRRVKKELHTARLERCSLALRDDFLAGVSEAMILDVAQDVFEVDVLAKRERLAATETCVLGLRCKRFFQIWQRKYVAQIRVKRAMLDFPSTAPNRLPMEQMQRLVPDRPDSRLSQKSFFINRRTKLTVQTPMEVIKQQLYLSTHLSMASARSMLASLILWRPFDLSHTVTPMLYKAFDEWINEGLIEADITPLQWKLCISFPKKETSTTESETNFVKWIRSKLCKDSGREDLLKSTPSAEGEVLSLYHVNADGRSGRSPPLGICIRAFHGKWTDDQEIAALNKSLLKGMSALLFVCSSAEDLKTFDPSAKLSIWDRERKRLHQMLKQKPKAPKVPLMLIVPRLRGESEISTTELDTEFQLSELRDAGFLSIVHVSQIYIGAQDHPIEFFSDWSSQLSNCLRFGATHIPVPPKLWAKPVSSYVESVVIELFKAPVYQDLRTRIRLQLLHQSPNTLISLYNEVIEHVALICASDDLRHTSWPAPEFDNSNEAKRGQCPTSKWNTDAHLCDLYELVAKMRLPYFRYSDIDSEDWATACRDVWAFLNSVTKKDSGSAKISLFQQTAQSLIRTKRNFDQLCWLASEDGPCEPSYTNMAWTDLIDACVRYKLLSLRSGLLSIRKPDEDDDEADVKVEDFEEVVVYYPEEELTDFEPPSCWTDALRDTETSERGQFKQAVKAAAVKRDQTLLEESASKTKKTSCPDDSVSFQVKDIDDDWATLKQRLEQERAATEKFQSHLAATISPTANQPCKSNMSSHHFGDFVSPILASSKENQAMSASLTGPSTTSRESRNVSQPDLLATPRRPLHRSYVSSTRRNQDPATEPQDGTCSVPKTVGSKDVAGLQPEGNDSDLLNADSTMSEKVLSIQERVEAQKQEDVLFEMKLRRLMNSSPLLL